MRAQSISADTTAPAKAELRSGPLAQVFFHYRHAWDETAVPSFGYGFTRSHVGYRHIFNPAWKAVVILDMGLPTRSASAENHILSEGSGHTMTLKFAYADWTPHPDLSLQFGSILQNHYITQERFWGFRFVEQTFQDRYYQTPSADLGAIAYVTLGSGLSGDVALTNGEGFRRRQDEDSFMKIAGGLTWTSGKDILLRGFASLTGMRIAGEAAEDVVYSLFIGWRPSRAVRVGVDMNRRQEGGTRDDVSGTSVFTGWTLTESWETFLRWDAVIVQESDGLPGESPSMITTAAGQAGMIGAVWTAARGLRLSVHGELWIPEEKGNPMHGSVALSTEFAWQ
ncbi:MAG: hypothetical protein JXA28_00270 [Bacteroidetes bacterium]|nr:hypothetical protein [Bacteroidota bacterium]